MTNGNCDPTILGNCLYFWLILIFYNDFETNDNDVSHSITAHAGLASNAVMQKQA